MFLTLMGFGLQGDNESKSGAFLKAHALVSLLPDSLLF
jgi:hypothetical protein